MLVDFTEGYYKIRGVDTNVCGLTFPLVEDYQEDKHGQGYVTVDGRGQPRFPDRNIRIRCAQNGYTIQGEGTQADRGPAVAAEESDADIIERLRQRFDILKDMTAAVKAGDVRAMIVTGPPGVGKSYGIQEVLEKDDTFAILGNRPPKYEFVKGAMSAVGLYAKLYEYSAKDEVLVFDDCDSVLLDDLSLNILKAALDSSKKRTIHWNTDSRSLRSEGIPNSFEYRGGCIFVTNLKFENVRSKKLQDHLAALESRCHYIDLQMDTEREKVLRIKQIVADGMLDDYELDDFAKEEVVDFVVDNKNKLRELSLRTVLKIADLRVSFPDKWEAMAEVTVMRRGV